VAEAVGSNIPLLFSQWSAVFFIIAGIVAFPQSGLAWCRAWWWVIRDDNKSRQKVLNLHAPRQHQLLQLYTLNCQPYTSSTHASSVSRQSSQFSTSQLFQPNLTFKMTGGGKSGGKASGSKNAQS
jgi:hypothetical protein